jgi:hypothetical protein
MSKTRLYIWRKNGEEGWVEKALTSFLLVDRQQLPILFLDFLELSMNSRLFALGHLFPLCLDVGQRNDGGSRCRGRRRRGCVCGRS